MFLLYNEYDKMSQEYNNKHINIICPECKSDNILKDDFHQETYCTHCGLVLQDTTIFKITYEIEKAEYRIKFIRNLWKKKKVSSVSKK